MKPFACKLLAQIANRSGRRRKEIILGCATVLPLEAARKRRGVACPCARVRNNLFFFCENGERLGKVLGSLRLAWEEVIKGGLKEKKLAQDMVNGSNVN